MKKEKIDDEKLGKILELLNNPYSSDDFWVGIGLIMQTSVSQERFAFFAARNGITDNGINMMAAAVYRGNSMSLNSTSNVESEVRKDFELHPWKKRQSPRLPWRAVGYTTYDGKVHQSELEREWEKRRPPLHYILMTRFEEVGESWCDSDPVYMKVSKFFTLLGLLRKILREEKAKILDYLDPQTVKFRMLTRLATGYNRNEASQGFLALTDNVRDNIARLRFFKWELEQELKLKPKKS